MKTLGASVLFMLTCGILGGCSRLAQYTPRGSSAFEDLDISLAFCDYCVRTYSDDTMDEAEKLQGVEARIRHEMTQRVRYPCFRSLCALLNGHFGLWDRMIVLEEISLDGSASEYLGRYGFIAVAIRGKNVRAVTNMHEYYVGWSGGMQLFEIQPDRYRLADLVSELNRAAANLPPGVVFDDRACDMSMFALHWIEHDKHTWSCALYTVDAYPLVTGLSRPARSASQVKPAELMRTQEKAGDVPLIRWKSIAVRDKEAFEAITGVYGDLMRRLWVSAMGEPKPVVSLFGVDRRAESSSEEPTTRPLFEGKGIVSGQ